ETQGRGKVQWLGSAYQALSKVVLPHPAGATMRVIVPLTAAFIRCRSRVRVTIFRRAGGTEIFVVSRWRDVVIVKEGGGVAAGGGRGRSVAGGVELVARSARSTGAGA